MQKKKSINKKKVWENSDYRFKLQFQKSRLHLQVAKSNRAGLKAKRKTPSNPKCRTLSTYAALEAVCSITTALSEIWAHTCFLSAAVGKPIKLDVFIAQGDLRQGVIITWRDKQALADSIFICVVNFQCTFLMILGFERRLSTWRCFPTHATGEQRFLPSPPCWHSSLWVRLRQQIWQTATSLKFGTFLTKT